VQDTFIQSQPNVLTPQVKQEIENLKLKLQGAAQSRGDVTINGGEAYFLLQILKGGVPL
jgi:hypothetical protein